MTDRNQAAHTEISPDGVAGPAANYALAIASTDVSRMLHSSGIVPIRPDGAVPDDLSEQATVVWQTIEALLAKADMEPTDIVSVTTYVVPNQDLATVMAARDEHLGGHRAASTLVVVPQLAQPAWKMEIAIVATA